MTIEAKNIDRAAQRYVQLVISDTGQGIVEEEQGRIFDLFYTTKKTGLGYGLWQTREYLTSMGGDVEITSRLGEGTIFTVLLPVYAGAEYPKHEPGSVRNLH